MNLGEIKERRVRSYLKSFPLPLSSSEIVFSFGPPSKLLLCKARIQLREWGKVFL
jgi:hypothetical protein